MKRFDQINMIPFIDIMLVLLAIVLTTASFISQGLIPVDLPQASQGQVPNQEQKTLEIAINAQNQVFFEGNQLDSIQVLAEKLKAYPTDSHLLLRMDKMAQVDPFVQVIDILKAGQFANVSIQTEKAP